ncbi:MAG: formylglycine-generating enzyme family protein [Gammaproteobacteria bacterium]|nr:formylglycine-generating enzyme family protein [Gammaproteobacteria bacterium]
MPTDAEWLHAATARGRQPTGSDFNCLLTSSGAVVKGGDLVKVNIKPENAWGLFNYVGNAQELVTSNSGLAVRGGHYNDPAGKCSIKMTRLHSGKPDKTTGFRLLREIK